MKEGIEKSWGDVRTYIDMLEAQADSEKARADSEKARADENEGKVGECWRGSRRN